MDHIGVFWFPALGAGRITGRKKMYYILEAKEQLRQYNINVVDERYIEDGRYITSAGVSAGIDMSLYLASKIAGEMAAKMIQLGIEYDLQPPFDCGSPEKNPAQMLER